MLALERRELPFIANVAFATLMGAGLRLYDVSGQILVSDEWHGLHAALYASYSEILSLLTLGATSAPFNLYYKLLLGGPGWSEWTLRLPSLVSGIALVGLAPLLLRRSIGARAASFTGYLLAISPLLILYSRYARPYAPIVLLTFVGFLACRRWATSGRRGDALVFAGAATLAAYFHLLEVRSLLLPLGFLFLTKYVLSRRWAAFETAASLRAILVTGASSCLVLLILFLPAGLSTGNRFFGILNADRPTLQTLAEASALLAGTNRAGALGVLLPVALLGAWRLATRDAWLAGLFFTLVVGCLTSVVATAPAESNVAIVLARYMIPLLPVGVVSFSCGVEAILERLERRTGVGARGFAAASALALLALLFAGPLPTLYGDANAFTNRKAFHVSYAEVSTPRERFHRFRERMDWRGARAKVPVSDFYRRLAGEEAALTLIEYPVPIGDLFSTAFIHQRIHGKRVLAGYFRGLPARRKRMQPGVVYASWTIDDVLGPVPPDRLHFRSLVPLSDPAAVRRRGADFIVLHRNLFAELVAQAGAEERRPWAREYLEGTYGEPVFEDAWIRVYELRSEWEAGGNE